MASNQLNYIDVAIAVLVGGLFIKGLVRGLFRESVSLFGLIAAFLIAMRFLGQASAVVDAVLRLSPSANTLVAFVSVFAISLAAFQLLANLLHKLAQKSPLSWIERLGGGLIGFLKGAVIASLLALFVGYIPFGQAFQKEQKKSILFESTRRFAPWVFDRLRGLVPGTKSFYEEVRDSFGRSRGRPAQDDNRKAAGTLRPQPHRPDDGAPP